MHMFQAYHSDHPKSLDFTTVLLSSSAYRNGLFFYTCYMLHYSLSGSSPFGHTSIPAMHFLHPVSPSGQSQKRTAGEFSTLSIGTLWPTRVRMLFIPYL
jgi:hypothetical protein